MRGPAFEVLPGRKWEKLKELKAEGSKKGFFSLCTGSQTGAKSSIFEHNSASASVSPSSKTFKDLVAKGHSSFNEEIFDNFSSRSGSLDHAPVPGSSVSSPSCGSFPQSELVKQAFSDPSFLKQVRGLEAMLRVRARSHSGSGFLPVSFGRAENAHSVAGASTGFIELLEDTESGASKTCAVVIAENDAAVRATAGVSARAESAPVSVGEYKRTTEFLKVAAGRSTELAVVNASAEACRDRPATAGESKRMIGLRERYVSDFPSLNSSGCLSVDACARLPAVPGLSASASSCASAPVSFAVDAHARSKAMHVARNSWSDTGRVEGPTGRRCTKGLVSGPAEDLRSVSEVEAGVNFRPAGGVRGQVAGSLPGRQPGTGTRQVKGGAVTPSLHPEVPGIQFVSPGYGLDIRQSMGWTKVCGTTRSGIWVLKGNARTCMFPANLDHLRVEWMKRSTYKKTAWVSLGHDCLCSYKYGHGAAVRPQTNNAIWGGLFYLFVVQGRTLLITLVW